jgi:hypothetical protein
MDRKSPAGLCAVEITEFVRGHPEWDAADIEEIILRWGLVQEKSTCFYCERGKVYLDQLPCRCPSCGEMLRGLFRDFTPEEQNKALIKRNLLRYPPEYSLAV